MEELRIANTTLPTEIQSFNDRIGKRVTWWKGGGCCSTITMSGTELTSEVVVMSSIIRRCWKVAIVAFSWSLA